MDGSRRPTVWTALALVVAVAGAGLAGYLISRPQATVNGPPAFSTPVPTPHEPFSTDGYSVADDPADNQVLVFGGDLSLTQTWLWNGKTWTLAHPRTTPPGREEAAAAYDPDLHMVLLFGGIRPAETELGDTWGWDGTTWHELDSGAGGPPPGQAAMAWDPALDTMVLMPASSSGADTWTWSRTHWTDHRQPDPYIPTGVLSLAFDPAAQTLMAVGFGSVESGGYGAPTETWMWSGAVWTQLSPHLDPSAYGILGLGWDPVTAKLMLFGQGPATLVPLLRWEWTGSDWVQLPSVPSPRIIEGLLTGDDLKTLLLVGELSEAPGAITPIAVWAWTGNAWEALPSKSAASAIATTALQGSLHWNRRLANLEG